MLDCSGGELPDIHRVKSVDVLCRIDGEQDFRRVDMGGQRKLHEDAGHSRIAGKSLDERQEIAFRGIGGQCVLLGVETALLRLATLVANVDGARRVGPHQNDGQPGFDTEG